MPDRDDRDLIRWFADLDLSHVPEVGGKNASLGEMIQGLRSDGIPVPNGFATTARAYREFLDANDLGPIISSHLKTAASEGRAADSAGAVIRDMMMKASLPSRFTDAVTRAYGELCRKEGVDDLPVAVRSSATAEDLPTASFAGQQESFLNVRGEKALLEACHRCFASLFTDRAIAYREERGYEHLQVALSVGVQRMVRSDLAGAGVLFTLETETGFPGVVLINGAWGLGESVVKGIVDPDQYVVLKRGVEEDAKRCVLDRTLGAKRSKVVYAEGEAGDVRTVDTSEEERAAYVLSESEVRTLTGWSIRIERHYGTAMDIEWAKDGQTGELFIVQARPETVWANVRPVITTFSLRDRADPLIVGLAVGSEIATGPVRRVTDPAELVDFPEGAVLVAAKTDPDWGPVLSRAAAVVTDHGGRTSHAAIVSREMGIPAVVGCGDAMSRLENALEVTVSCAEGEEGYVYRGRLAFDREETRIDDLPEIDLPVMLNVARPATAFRSWRLPARGIGLARIEFLIGSEIGIHPMALLHLEDIEDATTREEIEARTRGFDDRGEFFVHHLATGIAKIAASVYPHPAIVRTSDFKTNEYATLLGGSDFEPSEENPMLGFRGAFRYSSERYREAFVLECRALKRVRDDYRLTNVIPMIPFCRTLSEADRVLEVMAGEGLTRGEDGLEIYVMCEVPSNVVLVEEFSQRFDGFSIGSNDLTQLVLGVDRDSTELAGAFDERDPAVVKMIESVIAGAHAAGRPVGFCGQAPSNEASYAAFLLDAGIDSVSVDPSSVVDVVRHLATAGGPVGGGATFPR